MTMNKQKGFTVVELIVIVIVIAILVSITAVSYMFARDDAMDAKIKSTVKTAGDAIALHESKNGGTRIATTAYFNNAFTGVDSLVPTYLKPGYRDGLTSKNSPVSDYIFRWYPCNNVDGGFAVYAALNNPTKSDTDQFAKVKSTCGHASVPDSTSSTFPKYNYAQIF